MPGCWTGLFSRITGVKSPSFSPYHEWKRTSCSQITHSGNASGKTEPPFWITAQLSSCITLYQVALEWIVNSVALSNVNKLSHRSFWKLYPLDNLHFHNNFFPSLCLNTAISKFNHVHIFFIPAMPSFDLTDTKYILPSITKKKK